MIRSVSLVTCVALVGVALLSNLQAGGNANPNPGILPPHATYRGKTAAEWTVAWWEWVVGTEDNVQMFDEAGAFAHVNDNGADGVFFLAKSWAFVPQVREVTVPEGMPLLVPVMGIAAVEDPGGISARWGSKDDFFDFIDELSLDARDLSVFVDDEPVAALEDGNLHYVN